VRRNASEALASRPGLLRFRAPSRAIPARETPPAPVRWNTGASSTPATESGPTLTPSRQWERAAMPRPYDRRPAHRQDGAGAGHGVAAVPDGQRPCPCGVAGDLRPGVGLPPPVAGDRPGPAVGAGPCSRAVAI